MIPDFGWLPCPSCNKKMHYHHGEWADGSRCLIWQCMCGYWEIR